MAAGSLYHPKNLRVSCCFDVAGAYLKIYPDRGLLYSRVALKKYVKANNNITATDKMFDSLFNKALKAGVEKGEFAQPKGKLLLLFSLLYAVALHVHAAKHLLQYNYVLNIGRDRYLQLLQQYDGAILLPQHHIIIHHSY
jgi:hypothetical protein